jgi:hypothetical protein
MYKHLKNISTVPITCLALWPLVPVFFGFLKKKMSLYVRNQLLILALVQKISWLAQVLQCTAPLLFLSLSLLCTTLVTTLELPLLCTACRFT